ncbi:MAG: FAD-dependent monooxygenase [Pseudomonadales bacterium]
MKVIIIGAGIGGSALATALEQQGLDYQLLEQAAEFKEVGAGIQLSPNGVQILERLGLKEQLATFCTTPASHRYSVWDTGETILTTPLMPKVLNAYGFAYYHAHRADLIAALTQTLNPQRLCLNTTVTSVGQDASGVWADLADGSRVTGDVLVGADGVHSVVREQVFKPDPPRPSGYVTWRGVVDAKAIDHLDIPVCAHVDMGPKLSFVYYYVSGGKKFNWLALGETTGARRESWSQTSSRDEVLTAFDGWYDRPKQVIEATPETFVTALHDRNPLENWVDGRIALMGDAAHAMLPYHAQGAVQSLEDAWVLARLLSNSTDDPAITLTQFQTLRLERANTMVQQSRNAESWYHLDDPTAVAERNQRFRQTNTKLDGGFSAQQHWLYSYDAEKAALGTDDEWRSLSGWSG